MQKKARQALEGPAKGGLPKAMEGAGTPEPRNEVSSDPASATHKAQRAAEEMPRNANSSAAQKTKIP